ncbi:hypothetical protein JRQ81_017604, partial [Phrynocephalus forsythii]
MTKRITQKLNIFHQRCLRRTLGISYRDYITKDMLQQSSIQKLDEVVTKHRMCLAGHILQFPVHWIPKTTMLCNLLNEKENKEDHRNSGEQLS